MSSCFSVLSADLKKWIAVFGFVCVLTKVNIYASKTQVSDSIQSYSQVVALQCSQ